MTRRSNYLMGYFYYVVIFSIISAINILPQDNTNNRMQDKTNGSNNDLEKKIEQNANYYTSNLKTRLNLTDSQMRYIYDILLNYYLMGTGNQTSQRAALRESMGSFKLETEPFIQNRNDIDASSKANNKIENIIDNEQKNKWMEIKDTWWVNVKTELYEGNQNIKWNNDIHEKKGEYEDNRDYENFEVYYPGYDYK
jgi:hypothetical protein